MQPMTSQQKLQYAKILQKMYNLYIIKENLYFTHQNKNYNKAAKQIETVIEKQLKNNITAAIDGTIDLQKDINTEHIITTALKSQHKMLTRQDDRYLRTATKNNIKTYNKILQNRIEKESVSLQSKIEAEANRQKYRKLSGDEAKRILNSKFEGVGTKRAKNIVRDALHTNESNLSWIANLNNDYKYKIWMNGRGKGKVRPWHRAKQIQPCYIDDYFDIYGSYHAQMMYPGDLNGGAENVANCRCWIQYTNTPPSNLKTKGTIQVNPNVKLKNTNKKRYTQNNYSLISNIKNKTTTAISNIKNRVRSFNISNVKSKSKEIFNIKNKVNIKEKSFKSLDKFNDLDYPHIPLTEDNIPKDIPKNMRKSMLKFDKKIMNAKYEYGFIFNKTTGKAGEIKTNNEIDNVGLFKNENYGDDELIVSHNHLGLQPFNYADFQVISEHSQFNVVEMHVYTPNDIFIVEFKEKFTYTEEIDKSLRNNFAIGFLAGANKGEIGQINQMWNGYINDSILNEYMEFRRIRK